MNPLNSIAHYLAARDIEDGISRQYQQQGLWADALRARGAACTAHRDAMLLATEMGANNLPEDIEEQLHDPSFRHITDLYLPAGEPQ